MRRRIDIHRNRRENVGVAGAPRYVTDLIQRLSTHYRIRGREVPGTKCNNPVRMWPC